MTKANEEAARRPAPPPVARPDTQKAAEPPATARFQRPQHAEEPRPAPPPIPAEALRRKPKRKLRLGELLVKAGVVDDEAVERALAVQKMGGGRLGSVLVKLKFCTEQQIHAALSQQLDHVEVVELNDFKPDEAVLGLIPRELIRKYEAVPVKKEGDTVYVAMMDPYNLTAIDDIKFCTGARKLVVLACTEGAFKKFVKEHLATQSLIDEIMEGGEFYDRAVGSIDGDIDTAAANDSENEIVHDIRIAGEQPPIITLCNFLLVESINRGASDIHVEPYETYFRVRLRIDGRLQTLLTPPQRLHSPMVTRFKVLAEMDIANRRAPQDGHIALIYRSETCHYRVSTLPTVYGEKCVIRLLKKTEALANVDSLGFGDDDLAAYKRALQTPQGIVLVTGPTGSGKTTTLHAGLSFINDPEVNIVTLEDPVEASLAGINHVQIHEAAGITFSSGLRSILRQDPDVVFVGEMRDPEVSAIAVKAALTGHLVLSTLHTNSAAESLTRLADMGVARYLLANALNMVVAQRLMRRVCELCGEDHMPTKEELEDLRITEEQVAEATFRKGKGCSACYDTGYKGRVAVYEILRVSRAVRTAIRSEADVDDIVDIAREEGMKLLFEAGIGRALRGETTLAEVRRTLSDTR